MSAKHKALFSLCRLCLLTFLLEKCDCLWHEFDDLNYRELLRDLNQTPNKYCQELTCVQEVGDDFDPLGCGCKPSCAERSYDPVVSATLWPSRVSWMYKAMQYNMRSRV